VRLLPAAQVASTLHTGAYDTILQAYGALGTWVASNGYRIAGPSREIYLKSHESGPPEGFLTEIQFPVETAP
jgi:effector-binding domain-containing protein